MMLSFLAPALAFLKRIPWQVWVILALLAVWWIDRSGQYREGYRAAESAVEAKYKAAIAEANQRALDARKSEEEALVALAKETDDAIEEELRDELSRARDFIARNRVQNCPGSRRPAAPAPDRSAGNNAGAGEAAIVDDAANGFVVVPADDVLICTENTVKAEEWRKWGLNLQARNQE